jgi:hypothetical protein
MSSNKNQNPVCTEFKNQSRLLVECLNEGKTPLIISEITQNKTPDYVAEASSISAHYCFV